MEENTSGFKGNTERVLDDFKDLLSLSPDKVTEIGVSVPIPTFDESTVLELADRARRNWMGVDTLLIVEKPVYVIGDIHGNIFDLIRILVMCGVPPLSRIIFLGDYVDRGQYSIECITLLLALNIKFPKHVFLLRGNHEFERVNEIYGFKGECESFYGSTRVYTALNRAFDWMPIGARVGKEIFCIHGGISPQVTSFRQIKLLKRPIESYDGSITCDLLWSDPSNDTKDYLRSTRGNGVQFGVNAVRDFAKAFKLKHIIRGHQCVPKGIERFADDILYTVFSCSNYADASGNRCGIIFIEETGKIQCFSLPPLNQIPRSDALLCGKGLAGSDEGEQIGLYEIKNDIARNSILSLNSRPNQKTYMMKRSSIGRANASQLALGRKSLQSKTTDHIHAQGGAGVKTILPALKPRPLTAEPLLNNA